MASVAFVKTSASTALDGKRVRLTRGDAWDGDDPVVAAFPQFFSDVPEKLHRSTGDVVEQATAAPGEKRTVKRSAAKK